MRIANAHALTLNLTTHFTVCDNPELSPHYHTRRRISTRLYALPCILETAGERDVLFTILPDTRKQSYALGDVVCCDGVLIGRVPVRVFERRGSSAGRFLVTTGKGLEGEGSLVVVQRGDDPCGGDVSWDVVRDV